VPIINGDIGCYEQGGYGISGKVVKPSFSTESVGYLIDAPYETLDTNYIMGGGIGLLQGQFHAGYKDGPLVAVAGDSTFFHACIPAVINAVYNKVKGLFMVLDNSWTAMTGHQPNPGTGVTATGEKAKVLCIEDVAKACGVENIKTVDPFKIKETQAAIEEALKKDDFSIVVARGVCTLQAIRLKQYKAYRDVYVDENKCTGCKICVSFGCPAITFKGEIKTGKAGIDPIICVRCGMCAQVCPFNAIIVGE
jgi:indolepyruvate ferredoxin oxidoreductase alpha subunit